MGIMEALLDDATSRFQIASKTGAVAAGSGTKIIFYVQNTSAAHLALIEHVEINGHYATTAYAVGAVLYELYFARAFTAEAGTPHGTALTITGVNNRLKTGGNLSALAVVRIADTTSTGIAAGTWTLDSQPLGQFACHSSAGVQVAAPIVGAQYVPNNGVLFHARVADGESPIVLGTNEGIVVQVTVPGTGVAVHGVTMKWVETDRFSL